MSRPDQPYDHDEPDEKVVLSKRDARDAARLFQRLSDAIDRPLAGAEDPVKPDPGRLQSRARAILAGRKLRNAHFSRAMFGEPAWDMLLLLYIKERDGERQTPSKLAAWTGTPLSTTVRWIDYLEKKRLVKRQSHPTDKRIVFIAMLEPARDAMEAYLESLADPL